jgi:hypothetical protein
MRKRGWTMTGKAERLQYWTVFAAQIILLFIVEVMKEHPSIRLVFAVTMLVVFGSVIHAIWADAKHLRTVAIVIGLTAILCGAFGHTITGTLYNMRFAHVAGMPVDWMLVVSMCCYAIFVGFAIISIGQHIFLHDKVTGNVIAGSMCIYMLIGMFFAFCYTALSLVFANTFIVNGSVDVKMSLSDYFYYSYSALTTVGFGDITVNNGIARVLATLEAICGCLFIAVMIAGLVGTYFAQRKSR